jgi:hypothetical protein
MYARLVQFTLGPGTRPTADALMGQFGPALQARTGFKGVHFIGEEESGQYGAFILWESKGAAEAAYEAIQPKLQDAIKGLVEEQPVNPLYEVMGVTEPGK